MQSKMVKDNAPLFKTSLLTRKEACDYLRMGISTFDLLTKKENAPIKRIMFGRSVRFRLCDLDEFIETQRRKNQDD